MSTAVESTSSFAVHVPSGVEVRSIDGAVTMPEVVEGGTITFRINGAVRTSVPSALYQKVEIPVTPADVIANGTIGLTMSTEGPAAAGATCLPAGGVASMRKIELTYRGAEVAPTTVADFFPPSSAGFTVVIPENADADMITAGLTAVDALAYRYDDDTPISLSLTAPPPETATASQRVVALAPGRPGEVTTAVSTTSGIPMLTLTGTGDSLVDAARALSTDLLGLSGTDAQDLSQQIKPRSTAKTRTLDDLGVDSLAITGYGSVTQQFELRQDSFGEPVSSMKLHLEGSHTAFAAGSGARLDVRANGDLIGSAVLGSEAGFDLDAQLPAGKLRSVNDIELTLNALAPDGSACTPPSIPAAEVDLDTSGSTVSVAHGTGEAKGFQLFPQIFEGTLPVALRADDGRPASAAINAAALIAELQRAAGAPLEIQLMQPEAFLADDRSGLIVGALSADSDALDAPLELSSKRLVDRDNETVDFTSQAPYAALESIDRNDRLVLMLGSWAPDNKAAPGDIVRRVVDAVGAAGWPHLDGDLVIADADNPAFIASSRSLAPHQVVKKEKSYAKLFVIVISVLLLLLLLQLVAVIRRDRRLARVRDDELDDGVSDEHGGGFDDDDDLEIGHGERSGDGDADIYPDDYPDDYPDVYADDLASHDDSGGEVRVREPDPPPARNPEPDDELDALGDVDEIEAGDIDEEGSAEQADEVEAVVDHDEIDDDLAQQLRTDLDDDTGELPPIDAELYDEDAELDELDERDERDERDSESAETPGSEPVSALVSGPVGESDGDWEWEDWGDDPDKEEPPHPGGPEERSEPDAAPEPDESDAPAEPDGEPASTGESDSDEPGDPEEPTEADETPDPPPVKQPGSSTRRRNRRRR